MSTLGLQVIVGLGASGLSAARYFKERNIPFAVTDNRANPPQLLALQRFAPDAHVALGRFDTELLTKAERIILSPGIALHDPLIAPLVAKGVPVIGDIELFAEATNVPTVAITGTNAKSTVTTLVGLMAQEAGFKTQVGGNLGVPALDLLKEGTEWYVLELSSFQLETTFSLQPSVATILNISPDHMDRYDDLAGYVAAKARVYTHAKVAIVNRDDALTEVSNSHIQKYYFTLGEPSVNQFGIRQQNGKAQLAFHEEIIMSVSDLPVVGKHYQANALAALAIGHGMGLPFAAMIAVLKRFPGLPHRCQFVRELRDVTWYNDSKGTNVGATAAAIEGLGPDIPGKLIVILGGVGKNADFSSLIPVLQRYAREVVLIGEVAQELATLFNGKVPYRFAASMDEAIQTAAAVAMPKDCVLLSPACASFDMFKNFEHRGQVFMEIVERLH